MVDIKEILDVLTKECYHRNIKELFKEGLITDNDLEACYKDDSKIVVDIPSVSFKDGRKIVSRKKYHISVEIYISDEKNE